MDDCQFKVEYARTGRARCKKCYFNIAQDTLRIAEMVQSCNYDGKEANWFHYNCAFKKQHPKSVDDIAGYENIRHADQEKISKKIVLAKMDVKRAASSEVVQLPGLVNQNAVRFTAIVNKKPKLEIDKGESGADQLIIAQKEEYFLNFDNSKEHLSNQERKAILRNNNQDIPAGEYPILYALADLLTFGALRRCSICNGQYVFQKSYYICTGNISEWAKCDSIVEKPERITCRIPEGINHSFLKKKFEVKLRRYTQPIATTSGYKKEEELQPKTRRVPLEENRSQSVSKSATLTLKNGSVVDPGFKDSAHVYVVGGTKYFAVLIKTDLQKNKNSYYKLQLLEHDISLKYFLFGSWGRIGTAIGGQKMVSYSSAREGMDQFIAIYKQKTGNLFGANAFKKVANMYYPIYMDYGNEKLSDFDRKSELEVPVQVLIKLLFNVEIMKKTMLEFDLDLEKMPLGKLDQKQFADALKVLQQISDYLKEGATTNSQFIDASNRFYTLIPHDFGVQRPPVINTIEMVTAKTEMLESLKEVVLAYRLLKTDTDDTMSAIDKYYKHLNTDLQALHHDSEEFEMLKKYLRNSNAHGEFDLEILEIYKVDRAGEKLRYEPFKELHNRKLLWHGSHLTNYISILRNGLKIAPPDAPTTGYMFGKGIYFADMSSKSAKYCRISHPNSIGLMLLSEVALGEELQLNEAENMTRNLPNDSHSVKGLGETYPNPNETHVRPDGVEIPLGQPIRDEYLYTSLLYNEYIVYDVAQVNIQYLFKIEFKPPRVLNINN